MAKAKEGKKGRKHGRNEKWCQTYKARGTREKNKAAKIRRHLKKHPNDAQASKAV